MGSTTSLFIGLSGVVANSRMLDVIGNNIANVNTPAYKSNRAVFSPTFSRTFRLGTAPSATTGGTNPTQIGLGVTLAGTQRNFNSGSLTTTGVNTDLAIDGNGFFVLRNGVNEVYTRAGAFALNPSNELVGLDGGRVQGYAVDSDFRVVPGTRTTVTIPLGTLPVAEATQNVRIAGNLNAAGDAATQASLFDFAALNALAAAIPPPANPPFADSTTRLIDLDDGAGGAMFADGDVLRLAGAERNDTTIPTADLDIDTTTTVADFMAFLAQQLGIDTSDPLVPGGVTIDDTTGVVTIEGNIGNDNDLDIDSTDLTHLDSALAIIDNPFTLSKTQEADGESVRTTFIVYDSLGNSLQVDLSVVLDSRDANGTTWRYYALSSDSADGDPRVGTGTVTFDLNGNIVDPSSFNLTVQRDLTGAVDPLTFTVAFGDPAASVTSLADTSGSIAAVFQDGSPIGTLNNFSIGEDGIIQGTFSNGLLRTIGQIVLAKFTNPAGLIDNGAGLFSTGPNSGSAVYAEPLTLGAGRIIGGSLEQSNVDLSQEFINLILASTGYSASGRVITTTNELIQQLLVFGR